MDVEGLHMNIDYVGSSGIILSTKQKAALQSSWVWGKIFGVKSGYFNSFINSFKVCWEETIV